MEDRKFDSSFFQNRDCRYFPCHQGVAEEDFNCLFCYCPLYALGKKCGGNCEYIGEGVKSCKGCAFPHHRQNYGRVIARYAEIQEVVRRSDGDGE